MSCPQGDLNRLDSLVTAVSGAGEFLQALSGPYLIVSNEPETITTSKVGSPPGPLTIYKGTIPFTGTQRMRLFFWHLNDAPESENPLEFGLMVHADGDAQISSIKRSVQNVPFTDASIPGICLAKAQLYDTLDSVSGTHAVGTSESKLWSASVQYGTRAQLIGCVMEFDVAGTGTNPATKLNVRMYCTSTTSVGSFSDDPPTLETPTHIRGWWPKSSIRIRMNPTAQDPTPDPKFNVNIDQDNKAQTGVCESSGPEHGADGFAALTGNDHAFDVVNKGCYGVNLEYFCPLENSNTISSGKCYAGIIARNIGAKYWGAAYVSDPAQPKTGLKKIKEPPGETVTDPGDASSFLTAMPQGAIVIPPEGADEITIRVANGGAAALPVNLILSNSPVLAEPTEEPGGD